MDPFIIKKIVSNFVQFIPALPILLLLCSLALPRMRLFVASIALSILALSSPPVSNAFVASLEDRHPPLQQAPAETTAIAVLGYGHNESPERAATSVLLAGALSRLREAVRLWHTQPEATLIVSGGYLFGGSAYTHAEAMARAAIEMGVDQNNIRRIEDAKDTAEEADLIQAITGDAPIIVVTSATHIPRAMELFRGYGVEPIAAPTDYLVVEAPWWRFSSYYLYNADRALHEYVGMLWNWLSAQRNG